jgi:hypothetical protein
VLTENSGSQTTLVSQSFLLAPGSETSILLVVVARVYNTRWWLNVLGAGAGAECHRAKPVGPAGEVSCDTRVGRRANDASSETRRPVLEGVWAYQERFSVEAASLCVQTQGSWLGWLGGKVPGFVRVRVSRAGRRRFSIGPWPVLCRRVFLEEGTRGCLQCGGRGPRSWGGRWRT